ncbi:PqqD family protein [Sphingosinicella sp. BN140058]|uniref:PqqD family protein n=1 Tax=Sphingosinicella sp. BN140058 TaxID=1892855 RepID=UPI001010C196|nr:PqqD family protein [Sphingosinicella sp. BN140058]QAY78471.1 PqqD family protein [Sphingosinicella sp. BN140058]
MHATFVRAPDVPTAEFGDELAVMDLKSGAYIAFNRTAADIWKLLESPRSLEQLCETLERQYRIDPERCREDVEGLLRELEQMGVIHRRDG